MFQGNLSAGREAAFLSLLMLGAKEGGSLELSPEPVPKCPQPLLHGGGCFSCSSSWQRKACFSTISSFPLSKRNVFLDTRA